MQQLDHHLPTLEIKPELIFNGTSSYYDEVR